MELSMDIAAFGIERASLLHSEVSLAKLVYPLVARNQY